MTEQISKKIPLKDTHVQLGAKLVPFAGFDMPVRYSSDIDEHNAVREKVGVFDVSHMGEFRIKGPQALDLIQWVCSNDASKLSIGQAQYTCMPNLNGGIVDDLLVYKIKDNEYFLVVNAGNISKDFEWIKSQNKFDAEISNESDSWCLLAVQGPATSQLLQKITDIKLSNIPYYHFQIGVVAGIENIIVSNTGYTGAGGFELYVDKQYVLSLWNALFENGKAEGLKPIGLGARDTLRLEMGYCLYGNDINDTTSPLEAGLGWITKLSKICINHSFLVNQKNEGVHRKLVGFKMIDKGIPRAHYEIFSELNTKIGEVSSGTMSPTLGYGIGMGYVSAAFAEIGSTVYVSIRDKKLKAEIVRLPFLNK